MPRYRVYFDIEAESFEAADQAADKWGDELPFIAEKIERCLRERGQGGKPLNEPIPQVLPDPVD